MLKIFGLPVTGPQHPQQLLHMPTRFGQQQQGNGICSEGMYTTFWPQQHGSIFMQQHIQPRSTTSSFGWPCVGKRVARGGRRSCVCAHFCLLARV